MGMSEAEMDEVISEFFGQENPYLGIYSKADGNHLRIIARAKDESTARSLIYPVERAIEDRLAPFIWGYDEETPDQAVGIALRERGFTLATMESNTGGYLVNSLTDSLDSASYFKGGLVAIGDDVKIAHGVPAEIIQQHGSVSQQTADAMAQAVIKGLGADYGIGISGADGTPSKDGQSAGLAYLSIAGPNGSRQMELRVPPRRVTVKRRMSNNALIELRKLIVAEG
jgi:nicotinamide-nucleotide amidase